MPVFRSWFNHESLNHEYKRLYGHNFFIFDWITIVAPRSSFSDCHSVTFTSIHDSRFTIHDSRFVGHIRDCDWSTRTLRDMCILVMRCQSTRGQSRQTRQLACTHARIKIACGFIAILRFFGPFVYISHRLYVDRPNEACLFTVGSTI